MKLVPPECSLHVLDQQLYLDGQEVVGKAKLSVPIMSPVHELSL